MQKIVLNVNITVANGNEKQLARLITQLKRLSVPAGEGSKSPPPAKETKKQMYDRLKAKIDLKTGNRL